MDGGTLFTWFSFPSRQRSTDVVRNVTSHEENSCSHFSTLKIIYICCLLSAKKQRTTKVKIFMCQNMRHYFRLNVDYLSHRSTEYVVPSFRKFLSASHLSVKNIHMRDKFFQCVKFHWCVKESFERDFFLHFFCPFFVPLHARKLRKSLPLLILFRFIIVAWDFCSWNCQFLFYLATIHMENWEKLTFISNKSLTEKFINTNKIAKYSRFYHPRES